MDNEIIGYAQAGNMLTSTYEGNLKRSFTIKDRIADAVQAAEARLTKTKRAKEILDKNPELEELLNIMQQGFF